MHPTPSAADRERFDVQLGLTLPAPPPTGTPPTLEEIDAWRLRRLPPARANEVRAYVARDPVYYQQWFELRQAAAEAAAAAPSSATRALQPPRLTRLTRLTQWLMAQWPPPPLLLGSGLAAALGLVLTVTLVLLEPAPPEWSRILDEDQVRWASLTGLPPTVLVVGSTRGTGTLTPEQHSFQIGVRAALTARLVALPAGLTDWASAIGSCESADTACRQRQQLAETLGHWTALAHLACTRGQADRQSLAVRLAQWRTLMAAPQLEPWATALSRDAAPCDQVLGLWLAGWERQ